MKIHSWDEFLLNPPSTSVKSAMSIGVFDGVHRGHRKLFSVMESSGIGERWIFTFSSSPRKMLRPDRFPGDITTLGGKLSILEEEGIDRVVLIDFSDEFSKLTGREFLFTIIKRAPVHLIVLGDNFRCGRNGDTSAYDARDMLKPHGIEVVIPTPVTWNGLTISSSRIRSAIQEGDFSSAWKMTERALVLDVANIPQRPEKGAITIERNDMSQVLPPPGKYQVHICRNGKNPVLNTLLVTEASIIWPENVTEPAQKIQFVINEE